MPAATYHTLGRTSLRVSRLSLGAMTFGTEWGWGSDENGCREQLARYLDWGGNFLDTADVYTQGTSERILGKLIAERKARDRIVLATKFTHNPEPGNPNSGGNGRKNILRALEASLQRLGTDYIDLYILHCWDGLTEAEEVLRSLESAVQTGKIRHIGLSDVPAWYAASMQTLSQVRALEPVSSLQLEYSLIERNIEREFVPMALAHDIGITAWSPLCSGILSGKYADRASIGTVKGRLKQLQSGAPELPKNDDEGPQFGPARLTAENLRIVEALRSISLEIGRSMAQVAINWVANRPAVSSVILGASKPEQLTETLQSLDFDIPATQRERLEQLSKPAPQFPYTFFSPSALRRIYGDTTVSAKPPGYRGQP